MDHGLVLDTNYDIFEVDTYHDAGFEIMYGHKNIDDLACAKSCTGFIITFDNFNVLCISRLQTETSLSKMESQTIALADCCQQLFPIINMTQSLGKTVGLPIGVPLMKVSVHEDNSGALILSRTLTPKFTPRSKYYATKTIWFCQQINKRNIAFLKITTTYQLGDIFTKGIPRATFEYLRNKIMGW